MQHFGTFKIGEGKGPGNFCEIVWLTSKADWSFVETWEAAAEDTDSQSMRDSLEYAQIGAKRWSWLSGQGTCVTGFEDIESRTARDPDVEFGIALAVLMPAQGRNKRVAAFCYVRRIWLNHLYLEFLAVVQQGVGSLLLYALAEIAKKGESTEIWGECTAGSQGFYRRIKAKLLSAHLNDSLEKKSPNAPYLAEAQLPGAVFDRFVFGKEEIDIMCGIFRTYWAY